MRSEKEYTISRFTHPRRNRIPWSARTFVVASVLLSNLSLAQGDLDSQLKSVLAAAGFSGRVESGLEPRLGRTMNPKLADLGRLLWFDPAGGLHSDNTCGGCHSPANGFGDSQSIAIGVQNNNIVGPNRTRAAKPAADAHCRQYCLLPRADVERPFFAPSGDPFNNSLGYTFPLPEGTTAFPPNHPVINHLLIAQAHIPPTELVEVAGFTGTAGTIGPEFDQFDDGFGSPVPPPDATGFRNEPIRQAVLDV